jgi:hypothetical protein
MLSILISLAFKLESLNVSLLCKGISDNLGIKVVLLPNIIEYRAMFDKSISVFDIFLAFRNTPGAS